MDAFTGKGINGNFGWKFSYFAGMTTATMVFRLTGEQGYYYDLGDYKLIFFDPNKAVGLVLPWYTFIISGLLVGLGMRMSKGCTSGHGLNGLALLSPGSFVSIILFMVFGFAFGNLCYYTDFLRVPKGETDYWGDDYTDAWDWIAIALFAATIIIQVVLIIRAQNKLEFVATYTIGIIFALGLMISGMSRTFKVIGFLTFNNNWDPSLAFVMGFGVLLNLFTFRYIKKNQEKPRITEEWNLRPEVPLSMRTFIGASLFGVGWGMGGLCPGPGMLNFFVLNKGLLWNIACGLAMFGTDFYDSK